MFLKFSIRQHGHRTPPSVGVVCACTFPVTSQVQVKFNTLMFKSIACKIQALYIHW